MKKLGLGQTINTLANLGVIAGIIFLAFEIRASTRATQASSIQAATALDQEHLLLVGSDLELAKLWQTYLSAPETLTEDEIRQGNYLLAAAIRRLENVYLLNQLDALSTEGWESRQYLLNSIAQSRGYAVLRESDMDAGMNQEFLELIDGLR